jgi:hypothetical protein
MNISKQSLFYPFNYDYDILEIILTILHEHMFSQTLSYLFSHFVLSTMTLQLGIHSLCSLFSVTNILKLDY